MNQNKFIEELNKLSIDITDEQIKQLDKYHELLVSWNVYVCFGRKIKRVSTVKCRRNSKTEIID